MWGEAYSVKYHVKGYTNEDEPQCAPFPVASEIYGRVKTEVGVRVRSIRKTEGQETQNLPEVSEEETGEKMAYYKNLPLDLMLGK